MEVTDILTTIDNALRDWTVGPDAMRWTPESDEIDERARAALTSATAAFFAAPEGRES